MHSRKSLLFNNTDIWIKKNGDPHFEVTMWNFDGAELCELVGLYILHILGEKYGKHRIGLYRDDGLACFGYTSGPQADRIRKDFIKIFKEDFDLSITCEINLKAVNFLDVTLNLTTGSPMLKTLSFKSFNWLSATRFAVIIQFWQNLKCRRLRSF